MPDHDQLVLTVPEAAKLLRISVAHAYALVCRGELPSLRLGRRVLVPRRALDALLDSTVEDKRVGSATHSPGDRHRLQSVESHRSAS